MVEVELRLTHILAKKDTYKTYKPLFTRRVELAFSLFLIIISVFYNCNQNYRKGKVSTLNLRIDQIKGRILKT